MWATRMPTRYKGENKIEIALTKLQNYFNSMYTTK